MYIGQTLLKDGEALSPWFPREADNAMFSYEEIDSSGGTALEVTVYHKNTEEAGPGTKITGTNFQEIVANSDVYADELNDLKEMVRFGLKGNGGTGWVMFRMLPPSWFDQVTPPA